VLQRRKVLAANDPILASCLAGLGTTLCETGRAVEAESLLREGAEMRRKSLPKGHALIADTESLLGACLSALGRYAEAEPLLLSSYEALKSAQGVRPAVLRRAVDRIIQLYEAWEKTEQAAEWRAKRNQLSKSMEKPKDR